ncbi:uncharacterized protein TNCV_3642361 [Trichonephila clavipes]|nr:uncharacterized protein TNCV_3642361 [Trichonephila clavipes]
MLITCSTLTTFKSSSVIASSKDCEANARITYAMRTVGLGFCGIKNFPTAMDLPPPVSQKSYERILRKINLASREVAEDSMKNAAKAEVSASGSNEICVSGDGTWNTRGHTSRIGVCSVIGDVTGKVIDVAVMSSNCKGYEKWRGPKSGHSYEEKKFKHQPHCVQNHIGSSSKIEVGGMSNDEEPMQHVCKIGGISWCKYQKAVATNSASLFKHKNIVSIAIMDEIKPI